MRVAVILSGDIRNFDECYSSLESNILRYNECDIFMHAYDEGRISEALELFKPRKFLVDAKNKNVSDIHSACFHNKPPEANPESIFAMWNNVKKSFSLVDQNYDFVLKTRYDVKYCSPLEIKRLNSRSLWIPEGGDWRGGLFDMLCVSSYENMKMYCSLYDKLNEYSASGVPCHSETMLRHHVNKSEIQVNRFDYTVLLRRTFDKPWVEDKVFTIR